MNPTELLMDKDDGSPEDMCYKCRETLYDEDYDHEFMFENLSEGVTKSRNMANY
jgi:hypothetical protein